MIWNEGVIAKAISTQVLAKKCVVLVNNCNWTGYECDVLAVTTDLRIIDVEIKISRADLKADAKKDKWWRRYYTGEYETVTSKNGWGSQRAIQAKELRPWPPKVWKHYYAMPADIWKPDLVEFLPSESSGIILLHEAPRRSTQHPHLAVVKRRAKPNKDAHRLTPQQTVDIARLANLRMWEAYTQRDASALEAGHYLKQLRLITGDI